MLSISPPAKGIGRAKYYMELAREDYYLEGGEPVGKWFGEGARYLGLEGKVLGSQFHSLIQGFAPITGVALVQNAGEDRQALWDLTFSAPKSVSVAWSQAPEPIRHEIQQAHEQAVRAALTQAEELYGWTRRGKEGQTLERAHLVSALFEHGTSRAQDPQLHTHALLFNVAIRDDLSTGSIFVRPVFEGKMVLGALYRAEFAMFLERIGFTCERGPQQTFELKGRDSDLCSFFSKRSHEIRHEMNRLGLSGAVAAQKVTLGTRETKDHQPRSKLMESWRAIGLEKGWGEQQVIKSIAKQTQGRDQAQDQADTLHQSLDRLMKDNTHFTRNALIRAVAEEAQTRGVSAKDAVAISLQALKSDRVEHLGKGFYTTKECLQMEKDLLSTVEKSRDHKAHALPARAVEKKLMGEKRLSEEQKAAVRHITAGQGSISVVSGLAGTGKSSLLKVARELWEKEGYTVYGAAFTGKAARELQTGAGIESRTISKTQLLLDSKFPFYRGKKLIAPNAPSWSPLHGVSVPCLRRARNELHLTSKSVLVVDEAGMVPTPQMKQLIESAARAKAKIVLVGDEKQLQAIGQGGAFSSIARRLGAEKLTEIKRQRDAWGREFVRHFANGEAGQALGKAAERGLINVTKSTDEAKAKLISDWKKEGTTAPEKNLILSGKRADAEGLNKLAQEQRIKARVLGRGSLKNASERIYEGDRILFTKNSTRLGVQNGTLATAKTIDRKFLTARLDTGDLVKIPHHDYQHFQLGYAVTTHKAQGMTTNNAFILLDSKMQDLHLSYVQASRAREMTAFYMDKNTAGKKLEAIAGAMSKDREKRLATDILEQTKEEERVTRQKEEQRRQEEQRRRPQSHGHEHSY